MTGIGRWMGAGLAAAALLGAAEPAADAWKRTLEFLEKSLRR